MDFDWKTVTLKCPVHGNWIFPSTAIDSISEFAFDHRPCPGEHRRRVGRQYPAPPAKSRRR